MSNRRPEFELYRVLMMLGICLLHSITQGGHLTVWAGNLLCFCVCGFVVLSGYFGINFRPSKLIKLYSLGAFAAVTITVVAHFTKGSELTGSAVIAQLRRFWFLHAYAILMLLSPMINGVFTGRGKGGVWAKQIAAAVPLYLLVCVWGFGLTLPVLCRLLPNPDGLEAYGAITLMASYVAGRLYAFFESGYGALRLELSTIVVMGAVAALFCALGFGDYNSPFAIILAICTMRLVSRVKCGKICSRLVILAGPSMFSVYLLHSNTIGFGIIKRAEDYLLEQCGWNLAMTYLLVALSTMAVCVAIDSARRALLLPINRYLQLTLQYADKAYSSLESHVLNRCRRN